MSIHCLLFFFFYVVTNISIYLFLSFIFHSLGLLMFVLGYFSRHKSIPCGVYVVAYTLAYVQCALVCSKFSLVNYVPSCVITSYFFPVSLRRGW